MCRSFAKKISSSSSTPGQAGASDGRKSQTPGASVLDSHSVVTFQHSPQVTRLLIYMSRPHIRKGVHAGDEN